MPGLQPVNQTWLPRGGGDLATWIIAISILVSTILSILAFLGIAQGMQMRVWRAQVESRLRILESYIEDVKMTARRSMERNKVRNPDVVIRRALDYFMVSPVSIEPVDIIKRLERIIRSGEERIEGIVRSAARLPPVEEKKIVTLLSIANALNTIYKFIRHLLLMGIKTKNPMLVAQVWMLTPLYMRIAKAYRDAADTISKGIPIGDAAGPLAAYRLMQRFRLVEQPREVAKDTICSAHEFKGRRIYIVKAKGPGSTVGRPGEAVEKLVESMGGGTRLAAIITIDAALKFEGEETGSVAEGSGVAMGDPGPEKIRIERVAARLGVPLYAVAIKMGLEEAITSMSEDILRGVERAVEETEQLILEVSRPGDSVIIVGVGNTVGVAEPPVVKGGRNG